MKKFKWINLSVIGAACCLIFFVFVGMPEGYTQNPCDPPAEQCGPLMGNSGGTSFCCANTNNDCCYSGACGGNEQ